MKNFVLVLGVLFLVSCGRGKRFSWTEENYQSIKQICMREYAGFISSKNLDLACSCLQKEITTKFTPNEVNKQVDSVYLRKQLPNCFEQYIQAEYPVKQESKWNSFQKIQFIRGCAIQIKHTKHIEMTERIDFCRCLSENLETKYEYKNLEGQSLASLISISKSCWEQQYPLP